MQNQLYRVELDGGGEEGEDPRMSRLPWKNPSMDNLSSYVRRTPIWFTDACGTVRPSTDRPTDRVRAGGGSSERSYSCRLKLDRREPPAARGSFRAQTRRCSITCSTSVLLKLVYTCARWLVYKPRAPICTVPQNRLEEGEWNRLLAAAAAVDILFRRFFITFCEQGLSSSARRSWKLFSKSSKIQFGNVYDTVVFHCHADKWRLMMTIEYWVYKFVENSFKFNVRKNIENCNNFENVILRWDVGRNGACDARVQRHLLRDVVYMFWSDFSRSRSRSTELIARRESSSCNLWKKFITLINNLTENDFFVLRYQACKIVYTN